MIGRRVVRRTAACALAAATSAVTVMTPAAAATPTEYWLSRLQVSTAWAVTKGAGVTVAVLDGGVPASASLSGRLLAGANLYSGGSAQQDPGYSVDGTAVSHGQNMAELIAGDGDGGGLTGIAPAAKILPVKLSYRSGIATSRTGISDPLLAAGIRYAAAHGASVLNVSLNGSGACSPEVGAAIKYAYQHDAIVVTGSGDLGQTTLGSPANCPGAITVAGVNPNGSVWSGSGSGAQVDFTNFASSIDVVALDGRRGTGAGTSSSTALTSGEIALLRARYPHDTARQIVTRLLYTVNTLSSVSPGTRVNDHVGYGIPVPLAALTANVPADAPNPIYDGFAKELGAGSGNPASAASSSSPSGSPSSGATPSGTPSRSGQPTADRSAGGNLNPGIVVVIVVAALIVVGLLVLLAVRLTRRRPPPGGYGGPPPGGNGRYGG